MSCTLAVSRRWRSILVIFFYTSINPITNNLPAIDIIQTPYGEMTEHLTLRNLPPRSATYLPINSWPHL
jgi:hypothetical protein